MSTSSYTVIDIIKKTTDYLRKKEIENARLNSELLISFVLNLNRIQLYLNFEKPLQPAEIEKIRNLLIRRAANEPIQYILGETEFYSLKFKVNTSTLIPRPETEVLVDKALEFSKNLFKYKNQINILDIGTGSGNIAIALAKNNEKIFVTAIDVNSKALEIAAKNAKINGVADRINFILLNILKNTPKEFPQFDLIVSNPPYITRKEFTQLQAEVKDFEPRQALEGGEDGLKFYFKIAELAHVLLKDEAAIIVEIGASQSKQVVDIFSTSKLFHEIDITKDLNGINRVVSVKT